MMALVVSDVNRSAKRPGVILPVQYLRGLAALLVVVHHAREQLPGLQQLIDWSFGTSGVDLFFVISGFIMVVTTTGTSMGPWQFWQRRFVRVVPLYWLLTLLMVAIWLGKPDLFKSLTVTSATLLQSLLFIPHFSSAFPDRVWPLLVPGWTLNYEMFFYAVFGSAMVLPVRGRLAGLTLVFLTLVLAGYVAGPFASATLSTYTSPLLLEFLAGAWIGSCYLRGQINLPAMVSVGLLVLGFSMLVLRDSQPLGVFTQILGAILAVTGALNSRFAAWRCNLLRALGDSSYSLYLTHIFVLGVTRVVWTRLASMTLTLYSALAYLILSAVLCVIAGWLVYAYLESPITRKLHKK